MKGREVGGERGIGRRGCMGDGKRTEDGESREGKKVGKRDRKRRG